MRPNAFSVNTTVGVRFFPLGFELQTPAPGIWKASSHAQSVSEVADEIVRSAQPNLCIFDVGHTEADADGRRLLDLAEIARKAGIAPTELDIGTVMIKTQELPALLSALQHYEMCLLDFPDWIDPDAAYEAV
ncbi:MAG TPA: hypothetical protein VM509_06160, partial [Planctomycetota bacterium]|nr:hypothetical protein [Planctomycetota bacterium]